MPFLLNVENLTVGYKGIPVTENINFSLEAGDYLCIVGENGSGKSTLLKTLLSLISPVSGSVSFEGINKNEIGYLPQRNESSDDFPASVYEIVLSGFQGKLGNRLFYSKTEKEKAKDIIKTLSIEHLSKKPFSELSGGQRQRVLIARALLASDKLLILDEPVTGLDPEAQKELYALIEDLNKNMGITVIMISHDLENVKKYADHILYMGDKNEYC